MKINEILEYKRRIVPQKDSISNALVFGIYWKTEYIYLFIVIITKPQNVH